MPQSARLKEPTHAEAPNHHYLSASPPHRPPSPDSAPSQPPILSEFKKEAMRQHEILCRLASGTFTADKLIRLLSNIIKVVRSFQLLRDLKPLERTAVELGHMRRLLRVDRLCLIARDYCSAFRKPRLSGLDYFMIVFRAVILTEDLSDSFAYLIQMGVLQQQSRLADLRRRVADLYFLECIGWLLYYAYEWTRAETQEARQRNGIAVVRYLLDMAISHNDFSGRCGELGARTVSLLGVASSLLNLYLAWK